MGIWCSRAQALTAEGCRAKPRPAGWSGWVTTPTRGSWRSIRTRRDGTANCGVPMKTRRRGCTALITGKRYQGMGGNAALWILSVLFSEGFAPLASRGGTSTPPLLELLEECDGSGFCLKIAAHFVSRGVLYKNLISHKLQSGLSSIMGCNKLNSFVNRGKIMGYA